MGSKDWSKHSNLQCFLDATTPLVPSQSIPKTSIRDLNSLWQPIDKDTVECFTLGHLWEQYYEWSAYGLGVPIHLPSGEAVVQYYVPHLSAIQIYTSKSSLGLRNVGEDSESDSWSDDSESEKLSKSWDAASEDSACEADSSWPVKDRIGQLYLHYVEGLSPFARAPVMDTVATLATKRPGLISFKSMELSPASWMSISWYPIYHIPARKNLRDLSSAFLTYHTISSFVQDQMPEDSEKDMPCPTASEGRKKGKEATSRIPLHPFGLATYKMQGNLWVNQEAGDQDRLVALYSSADSWLKQLRVQHSDFNFFTSRSSMWIEPLSHESC